MNPILGIIIRNTLLGLSVWLVAKGYMTQEQADAWVSANTAFFLGLGGMGFAVVLSLLNQLKNSIFRPNGKPKPLAKIEERIIEKELKQ